MIFIYLEYETEDSASAQCGRAVRDGQRGQVPDRGETAGRVRGHRDDASRGRLPG